MPGSGPFPAGGAPAQRVGPYRLLRPLGRGGQATVWEALSEQDGRRVALKRIHPRALLLSPDASVRLRREVELLRGWSHPGVVALLDAGEVEGVPYLVYELVPGAVPLDEACRGLPLRARVRLVAEAAHALGAVHARGVIHRDVTPRNLLVDEHGRVRLVDFGLARGPDDPQLTRTGAALGTPGWLAPEVALEGSRAAAGVAADVWSLGAVLFQALTGEPPFAGVGLVDLVQLLERQGPPSPRARAPEVTSELDQVCRRALALHPADRYPDAASLAQALVEALMHLPATSPSGTGTGSTRLAGSWRGPLAGDPAPGERWGRWEILRLLGEGGMGRVFLAREEDGGREVALKVLPAAAGERQRQRFLREAQAGVRVRHEGLTRIHEAGEHQGRAWLVMDVAEGRGLNLVLEEGPLPAREAVRLCVALLGALEALHQAGIVHRDVKPENVVLGSDGRPRLLDLGVALLEDSDRLTRTHATVGTPLYMAPEQLTGGDVDLRADLWSLGAVLYEALTGSPPGGRSVTPIELAASRARPPAPPSRLRPGIDARLDAICLRTLAPDPRRRWSSAGEMAAALEQWLHAGPGTPRTWRRLLIGTSAAALLVVGLAVVLLGSAQATRRAAQLGRALEAQAREGPDLARLPLDPDLLAALARADPQDEGVRAARAWVGLVQLAGGDRRAARAALEALAGGALTPAGEALQGGLLALEGGDPQAALAALERASQAGLSAPELVGWRVRALAERGFETREAASAGLQLLEQAERASAGSSRDRRCLEAACRLALGEEAAAQAALAGVADPPPRLAWEVGLLGCQRALRAGRPRSAREAVRGLTRPPGPPTPREEESYAHVAQLTRAALRVPLELRGLRELADALELMTALGGGRPGPDDLLEGLRGLLQGPPPGGREPESARLAAAAAELWPGDLPLLVAAVDRAEELGAAPEVFRRLAAVAAGLVASSPPAQREAARARLALSLARAGRLQEAQEAAQALLDGPEPQGPPPVTRVMALLALALAERQAGRTDAALAHLSRAGPLAPGAAVERLLTLQAAGRREDAAREAAALVTQPERLAPRLQEGAELTWELLDGAGQTAPQLRLAQELVARGQDELGLWSLRLARLRARNGDAGGAKQALEAARERRFPSALDLPALLALLGKGDPLGLEVLVEAERAATAWRRASWQERKE